MLSNDEHGMIEKSLGDNPLAEKTEKTSLSNSVTGQPATSNSVSGVATDNELHVHDDLSADEQMLENSGIFRVFKKLTAEEDTIVPQKGRTGLAFILGGDMLGGKWFKRQIGFLIVLILLVLIYVSNSYLYKQQMKESEKLHNELLDRRYKALTRSSQLKEKMLRSNIEQSLVDSTLQTATTPPFILRVD